LRVKIVIRIKKKIFRASGMEKSFSRSESAAEIF